MGRTARRPLLRFQPVGIDPIDDRADPLLLGRIQPAISDQLTKTLMIRVELRIDLRRHCRLRPAVIRSKPAADPWAFGERRRPRHAETDRLLRIGADASHRRPIRSRTDTAEQSIAWRIAE